MPEDVSAGRLHLDAYADTSGLSRGLQARINQEVANVRAKIKAEIDTKGAAVQAKAAAAQITRDAAASARVKIKAEIDARALAKEVKAAGAAASRNAVITFRAELDATSVAAMEARLASITAPRSVTVNVNADTAAAQAQIAAVGNGSGSNPVAPVTDGLKGAKKAADAASGSLNKILMMGSGFYFLAGGIVQAGAGLFSMASSAASAAGALAVIPNLLGVAAQGIGAVIAGFSGIGDAVGALTAVEQEGAAQSSAAADAREAAADRIARAQRGVGDAMKAAADSARQANEAVADANWALARSAESLRDAREALENATYAANQSIEDRADRLKAAEDGVAQSQENAAAAQEALTKARAAAQERIENLNRELRLSAADEASATFAVMKAQQDLEDARADGSATEQQRSAAEVALMQAQANLERQLDYQEDLKKETKEANKDGVDGADNVVAATEQVADTIQAEKDAREALADTIEANARDARDQARSVRDAEENVRDAVHAQGEAREAVADALRNQQDAAASSARAIADAQKEYADALEDQAKVGSEASAAVDKLKTAMDNLSPAGQRFAKFIAGTLLPRLKKMRMAIQEAILPGIQDGITKALPLLDVIQAKMVDTGGVVGSFMRDVGALFGSEAFGKDVSSIMDTNNKALGTFLGAGKDLIQVFKDIAVVAGPELLIPFSNFVKGLTDTWKNMAKTGRESGGMAAAFKTVRERAKVLWDILVNLGTSLFNIGKAAAPAGDDLMRTLRKVTGEWAKLSGSEDGQNGIAKFFKDSGPMIKAAGRLIEKLAKLFVTVSEGSRGPLTLFFNVLTEAANILGGLMDIPFVSQAVGWGAAAVGMGAGINEAAGKMSELKEGATELWGNLKTAGSILKKTADGTYYMAMRSKLAAYWTNVQTAATKTWGKVTGFVNGVLTRIRTAINSYRAAMAGLTLQQKIATTATMVWSRVTTAAAAVGRAFRLVATTMMGPWGIAIAAVVVAFILLYKKVGWFRKGVQAVMKGVVKAFNWVVDGAKYLWDVLFGHSVFPDIMDGLAGFLDVVKVIMDAVVDAFMMLVDAAMWLWKDVIKPMMPAISQAVKIAFFLIKTYIQMLILYWKTIAKIIIWAVKTIIIPILGFMIRAAKSWYNGVKTYIRAVIAVFRALAAVGVWLWNKIKAVFNGIKKAARLWWMGVKVYVNLFRAGLRMIGAAASWLWGKIRDVFNKIKDAAQYLYGKIIAPFVDRMKRGLENIGAAFGWLWDKVKSTFDSIKSKVDTVWSRLHTVFTSLKTWAEKTLTGAFDKMKEGVVGAFNTMANLALTPIRFVVDTIYNNGIRKMIGFLPGIDEPDPVNTDSWHFEAKTGGVIPGYTPGRDVHRFTSPTGGTLDLSGGEAVMRPEITRALGTKRIDALNAAARKGGTALRNAFNGSRLGYFLGGTLPLPGATSISQHEKAGAYKNMPYAGDLNMPGRADYGKPIVAWKAGVAHPFDYGTDTSYGRGQTVTHADGQTTMYAHMSKVITSLANQIVRAGQTIGYVGDYGNTGDPPTSHLHFEVRNGAVDLSDTTAGGPPASEYTPAEQAERDKGEKKSGGWKDAYNSVKNLVTKFPGWLRDLGKSEWGQMMVTSAKSVADDVRQWINDKIPDEISIPGPNIPLPKNPIPKFYDQGGSWPTGTYGVNMSGSTETVFTNTNMVDLSMALMDTARSLKTLLAPREPSEYGGGKLFETLELHADPRDVPSVMADANFELRKIKRGGVYARGGPS